MRRGGRGKAPRPTTSCACLCSFSLSLFLSQNSRWSPSPSSRLPIMVPRRSCLPLATRVAIAHLQSPCSEQACTQTTSCVARTWVLDGRSVSSPSIRSVGESFANLVLVEPLTSYLSAGGLPLPSTMATAYALAATTMPSAHNLYAPIAPIAPAPPTFAPWLRTGMPLSSVMPWLASTKAAAPSALRAPSLAMSSPPSRYCPPRSHRSCDGHHAHPSFTLHCIHPPPHPSRAYRSLCQPPSPFSLNIQ